jgi:galactokinase
MTGAGFGGCTVSILHKEQVTTFQNEVGGMYLKKTGLEPSFYLAKVGDGVTVIRQA